MASAPTPVNYSNIVDEAVTQNYMRGEWNNTKRINPTLEFLDQSGAVTFDGSGKYTELKVRLGEWQGGYRADLAQRNFARKQHRATLVFPWAFLEIPMVVSERDLQFLNSPDAVTKFVSSLLTEAGQDFRKLVGQKILTENAQSITSVGATAYSGSDVPLYGLPTMFGHDATVQAYDADANTTSGNIAATDAEALPNCTYAGLSTNPVTGVSGVDNMAAGSMSPVLVNYTSSAFGATTWAANCTQVVDRLITRLTRSNDTDDAPNLGLCSRTLYLALKEKLRSQGNQQVVLEDAPRSPNHGMYPRRMIPYNGLTITFDNYMTASTFYCLNTRREKLEYRIFPQKFLAGSESGAIKGSAGAEFRVAQMPDIDQGGHKAVVVQSAQLIGNPFYQGCARAFA